MATFDAVGAVGLTLQALLRDRLQDPNGGADAVPVSLGFPGPDRDPLEPAEAARVNLFLYQVTENGYLRNQEIPGHGHPGSYGHPPLSLELHYLLTVFGTTENGGYFDETPAHNLLGSAMQVLHEHAVITATLTTRRAPVGVPVLAAALRGEHENVKLTLRPLGLEDLTNVWTSLELSYRLSAAYEVSVVQIESTRPRRHPRPVQELPGAGPRVFAATLRRPQLTSVAVRRSGDAADRERPIAFARVGDTLILRGSNLGGGAVVRLGGVEVTPDTVSAAGDRLEVTVPDDTLPGGASIPPSDRLQPGAHAVQVAATAAALPQAAVASGRGAFVLVPAVSSATVAGRVLTLTGTRLTADGAPAQVVVGDAVVEAADYRAGSSPTEVEVTLPTTLPAAPVHALVSGDLSTFPAMPGAFDLEVTIGSELRTVTLNGTPGSLSEAAALTEAALRDAAPLPAFSAARVAATDRELIVVSGDLESAVTVADGDLADALLLSTAAAARPVLLSGILRPFPSLTRPAPELDLTLAGVTHRLTLGSRPASVADAASVLGAAIRSAAPEAAFSEARVAMLGDRLCVLPGAAGTIRFAAAAGSDETTVAELQLAAAYLVRARVAGVESVDEHTVELPP